MSTINNMKYPVCAQCDLTIQSTVWSYHITPTKWSYSIVPLIVFTDIKLTGIFSLCVDIVDAK